MNFRLVYIVIDDIIVHQTLIILSLSLRDAAIFMEYMYIVYNIYVPQWDIEVWIALVKWNSILIWICLFSLEVT